MSVPSTTCRINRAASGRWWTALSSSCELRTPTRQCRFRELEAYFYLFPDPLQALTRGTEANFPLFVHPFGQTPVINLQDDDGFIVYESRAICRYFAEKYAGRGAALVPTCLEDKTRFEQAASVEFANFNPPILKIIKEVVINPFFAVPANAAVVADALSDLSATLEVYDCILSRQKYLAGNELTLADISQLAYAPSLADALF